MVGASLESCGLRPYGGAPGSRGAGGRDTRKFGLAKGPGGEGRSRVGEMECRLAGRGWQRAEAGERGDWVIWEDR